MGYRVDYQPVRKLRNMENRTNGKTALTAAFLMLFFLLVFSCWPRGAELVKEMIIPGEPEVTLGAVEQLAARLQGGEPLAAALEAFCCEIMVGAQP